MTDEIDSLRLGEQDLYDRLAALGIEARTVEHEPLFTVEDSKSIHDEYPGGHCKSLFVKNKKGQKWLVVMRAETRLDIKALEQKLGSGRLSFCSPERLMEHLGVIPGSVTPFSVINDQTNEVQVVLDQVMMELTPLHYHPLRNDKTTMIRPADLLAFLKSENHDPVVLDLDFTG